jgi:hypothetical protein
MMKVLCPRPKRETVQPYNEQSAMNCGAGQLTRRSTETLSFGSRGSMGFQKYLKNLKDKPNLYSELVKIMQE